MYYVNCLSAYVTYLECIIDGPVGLVILNKLETKFSA